MQKVQTNTDVPAGSLCKVGKPSGWFALCRMLNRIMQRILWSHVARYQAAQLCGNWTHNALTWSGRGTVTPRGAKMRASTAKTRSTIPDGVRFSAATPASPDISAASTGPPAKAANLDSRPEASHPQGQHTIQDSPIIH